MPDGPRYDDDFYAWTKYQADVLRSVRIRDNRFDREHVAEEIEDLGKSYRDAARSQVRRILEHLLKLAYSPATDPRADWMTSIAEARDSLKDQLTPTLRHDVETMLDRLYQDARHRAEIALGRFGEVAAKRALPAACPYSLDEIVQDQWYPEGPK
ncbi:MAG TPA: DUF29 domain-containing protein [Stellaceae bacterium]|jgi:hypothetical protein|nr:DUF29 domain-containing protein [Stellaceae bacterium]